MAKAKRKPMNSPLDDLAAKREESCAAQHFGPWFINGKWMNDALAAIRCGAWQPSSLSPAGNDDEEDKHYEIHNGVAVIHVTGQITKRGSSFGGASAVRTKRAVRVASEDPGATEIMLVVDSPGGSVFGIADLANEIDRVDRDAKNVYAYCQDMACSAGYWIASQARRVYCNETAMVGCIGTYGVLVDTSKADAEMGLDYVLISSGGVKGMGADGKVTEELVADYRREIMYLQDRFNAAVMRRRGFSETEMKSLADGRAHIGQKAVDLGLADEVGSLDAAIEQITAPQLRMRAAIKKRIAAQRSAASTHGGHNNG